METIEIIDIIKYRIDYPLGLNSKLFGFGYTMRIRDKYEIERTVDVICDSVGKHVIAKDNESGVTFEFSDWEKRIQDCIVGDLIEVTTCHKTSHNVHQLSLVEVDLIGEFVNLIDESDLRNLKHTEDEIKAINEAIREKLTKKHEDRT